MTTTGDPDVIASVPDSDSALWSPGNYTNATMTLLTTPICLTVPATVTAIQDFPACPGGSGPYLTMCYVREKCIMTYFKSGTCFSFLCISVRRHLEFGKISCHHLY